MSQVTADFFRWVCLSRVLGDKTKDQGSFYVHRRLRLNHAPHPSHLHKIDLHVSPFWACGHDKAMTKHYFLFCSLRASNQRILFSVLSLASSFKSQGLSSFLSETGPSWYVYRRPCRVNAICARLADQYLRLLPFLISCMTLFCINTYLHSNW